MPVVYIDVVWLINLVMDATILAVTCWICKRPIRPRRILSGAIIGSLYALLLFTPSLSTLTTWPGKALASLLMVGLAVPSRSWLDLARTAALFYFVAFVFAGAAVAMNFAVPGVSIAGGKVVDNHSLMFVSSIQSLALLVAIPTTIALTRMAIGRARQWNRQLAAMTRVRIRVGERTADVMGLIDTGNQLRDPVSRRPVCLVEAQAVKHLLPDAFVEAIDSGQNLLDALTQLESAVTTQRFSLVPYTGAGGVQTLSIAFRPDKVEIHEQGHWVDARSPCLFALHEKTLSTDARFQALLHTELVTGDESFEQDRHANESQLAPKTAASTVVDTSPTETRWR